MRKSLAAVAVAILLSCVGTTGLELQLLKRDFDRLRESAAASGDWVGTLIGAAGSAAIGAAGGAAVARRKKTRGASN